MKVFQNQPGMASKTNFVDENNVVLGYDMFQRCCECAGWFVADRPAEQNTDEIVERGEGTPDLDGYVFDPEYFRKVSDCEVPDKVVMVAVFRLVKGESEKFLHLYNCHNGYYSHGFTLAVGGEEILDGDL